MRGARKAWVECDITLGPFPGHIRRHRFVLSLTRKRTKEATHGRSTAGSVPNAPVVRISGLRRGSAPIGERGEDREGRSRPANATGASVCQSRRPGCGCCRGSCAKRDWGERLSIPSGQDAGCAEGACQTRLGRAHGRLPAISLTNASLGSVSGLRRPGAAIGERGQDRGGRSRPANASGESVCQSQRSISCDRSPLWWTENRYATVSLPASSSA